MIHTCALTHTTYSGTIIPSCAACRMSEDHSVCTDDDCPLPEHEGPCPENRTLEMWRIEAQRTRALVGEMQQKIRKLEERLEIEKHCLEPR